MALESRLSWSCSCPGIIAWGGFTLYVHNNLYVTGIYLRLPVYRKANFDVLHLLKSDALVDTT